MGWIMRKCLECDQYTLDKDKCPNCGGRLRVPHPSRFSPDDKYAKYKSLLKVEKI